jgi:hypothetical protein
VSPKKTPRGGRYTKSVRRDGSQTYGRRGCLDMVLIVVAILCAALAVVIR